MTPWDKASPMLQRALDKAADGLTLQDVAEALRLREAELWVGNNSAAVTEQSKDVNVWLFGGDLSEAQTMLDACEAFARAEGCKTVSIYDARPGWERFLRDEGYERRSVLVKVLR